MGEAAKPKRSYGVRLVRGPFVRLGPHPDHHDDEGDFVTWARGLRASGARLAADLFSGAGGLSLGLEAAGWTVVLSSDHYPEAVETHRHHFGGMSLDWDLSDPDRVGRIATLIREAGVELLAGGPPCQPFSKAGRSMIRHRVLNHERDPRDERRELWRSYLEIVRQARPSAVVMENVPDMALDREMFILRDMVHELEEMDYSVEVKVLDTSRFGVPQFRQRLILVALADRCQFTWPLGTGENVTVWNAIGDLPEVEGGWRPDGGAEGYSPYAGPVTSFQKRMRRGVPRSHRDRVFDHITRPVRDDDRQIFNMMDSRTRYSDIPEEMRRYRADIFNDKYKRLDENGLSRTIVAHIAKDGYSYIHPRQPRTLTVREAARIQTFPDWFRFAGPPSAAFKQIGNAVPPALGEQLGLAVLDALGAATRTDRSADAISGLLADWYRGTNLRAVPWLRGGTRFLVVAAEMLLDRVQPDQIRHVWPPMVRWSTPKHALEGAEEIREVGRWVGRPKRAEDVLEVARWLTDNDGALEDDNLAASVKGVNGSVADLAILAVPGVDEDSSEEPVLVTKGVLRVAARFTGEPVDRRNRLTDGRLAIAGMIGYGPRARAAHLALIEIANAVCRPDDPACPLCPLMPLCKEAVTLQSDTLFGAASRA